MKSTAYDCGDAHDLPFVFRQPCESSRDDAPQGARHLDAVTRPIVDAAFLDAHHPRLLKSQEVFFDVERVAGTLQRNLFEQLHRHLVDREARSH